MTSLFRADKCLLVVKFLIHTQGMLGNCYFLAAIQSCGAEKEDFLIRDLCIKTGVLLTPLQLYV